MTFRVWLRNTLLSGLAAIVPIGLTFYVLDFIRSFADRLFDFVPEPLLARAWRFPGSGILLALFVTLVAGILARNLFGRMLGQSVVSVVERVPVVSGLYKLFRQIAKAFLGGGGQGFKRVVLVEWPRRDLWTLAFVTGDVAPTTQGRLGLAADKTPWLSLFVPTTPNPTGGFYFLAPQSDVRPTDLTVEAAFKIIISGGALTPDS